MTKQSSEGKRFGYFVTMVVNAALIYVFNHLLEWNTPYLLPTFQGCLWAIQLSLSVTIFVNFIYIFYDAPWFRHLMQAIENVFSWISTYFIYTIFPFEFPAEIWMQIARVALIVALVLIPVGTLVEIIQFFTKVSRLKE